MTRLPVLVAVAVAAVLGLVAAPALSLQPYRPEPVDFSVAGGAVIGGPGGVVAKPIHAPKRFNLVGLTWTRSDPDPAIAIRTRADGDEWSRWTPVLTQAEDGPDPRSGEPTGSGMANPVWAGEADWVQYRSSEPLPDPELHFVNTAGTATPADRLQTALRGAVNTAFVSVVGLLNASTAGAAEPQPAIVPREDWGAEACEPRTTPAYGQVRAAYVHHTVNPNDYTRAEAPQIVLAMCRYHRNTNGWNDLGYNFVVDRFGTIYEGRAGGIEAAVIGAQAEGFNSYSTGIANIGTFSDVSQTQAALEAMARLIRWKLPLHGYPTTGTAVMVSAGGGTNRYPSGQSVRVSRVLGHRDTNATECPGTALYAQLDELRAMVGSVSPLGAATSVSAQIDAPRSTIDYGDAATVSGVLTASGSPVAGQAVNVQALVGGKWRTSSTPTTRGDGSFSATVKPKVNRQIRVRFAGAGDLRSSIAPTMYLGVRPIIRLRRPPRRGASGLSVRLRGRVVPRRARVYQVLQLERNGRFRKVGVKALRTTRQGSFSGSFVPGEGGRFRFYIATKADSKLARGASKKIVVRVRQVVRGGAIAR